MNAQSEHVSVSTDEADRAFSGLEQFDALILAVSGGSDSLALLHFVAEWVQRCGRPQPVVVVATVDHHLREGSGAEAELVAVHARRLGFEHHTLHWEGLKTRAGLQAAARRARYELLDALALRVAPGGRAALVTAHTLDDQAETVVMRLKRGSGVDGLAAIPAQRPLTPGSSTMVVRPLLTIAKSRLIASLNERQLTWSEDPSNADVSFERVRGRRDLLALERLGINAAALATTASRMQDAVAGLDYAATVYKATLGIDRHDGIFGQFDRRAFDAGPRILQQRVLRDLIADYGGTTAAPALCEVEALVRRLQTTNTLAATLGGAVVSAGPRFVRIWREVGRISKADVPLAAGATMLWDKRFWVSCDGDASAKIVLRPLGSRARATGWVGGRPFFQPKTGHVPARALQALPSLWLNGTLFAVPQTCPIIGPIARATIGRLPGPTSDPMTGHIFGLVPPQTLSLELGCGVRSMTAPAWSMVAASSAVPTQSSSPNGAEVPKVVTPGSRNEFATLHVSVWPVLSEC